VRYQDAEQERPCPRAAAASARFREARSSSGSDKRWYGAGERAGRVLRLRSAMSGTGGSPHRWGGEAGAGGAKWDRWLAASDRGAALQTAASRHILCCTVRGDAAAHARSRRARADLQAAGGRGRAVDASPPAWRLIESSSGSRSPAGSGGPRCQRLVLGLVLAAACVSCASATSAGVRSGGRLWEQGFVPSRALHRATWAGSSRGPPLGALMPRAGAGSRRRGPRSGAPRRPVLRSMLGSGEGAPVSTVTVSSEPRSELWGNWTEHEVKVATLLWIEKFVIGMKLCPFAVEAMNGLRVYVADATNRDMALDKVDVEIKWIVGLDKATPACTLMVYPPALFEKGAGDAEKTSPLCTSDQSDPASPSFMENCDLDDFCEGFDGFMSLASDAREMAQGFNAAHGQDIDTETLSCPLPSPSPLPSAPYCPTFPPACLTNYLPVYTHTHTHTHTHTSTHTYMHTHMYTRTPKCLLTHLRACLAREVGIKTRRNGLSSHLKPHSLNALSAYRLPLTRTRTDICARAMHVNGEISWLCCTYCIHTRHGYQACAQGIHVSMSIQRSCCAYI